MVKFEVGKTYSHRWIGDAELVTDWEVIARTEKTITIKDGNDVRKCRIIADLSESYNAETVRPFGKFSMCPVLKAK